MKKFSFIKRIKLNKQPKKRYLLKQISLLTATAIIFVFAVFAWFSNKEEANLNSLNVTLDSGNNLLISLDDGTTFLGSIDLMDEDVQQYISLDNQILGIINMKDITSDGKTFYRPVFLNEDKNRVPDTASNWETVTGNNSVYISEKIVFRTSVPSDIYLGSGTSIVTSAEKDNLLLTNTEPVGVGNMSGFGYFSNDCIVGALRISAINSSGELCYVNIPRTDMEMTKTVTDGVTSYSLVTGDDVSENTKIHQYYYSPESPEGDEIYALTTSDKTIESLDTVAIATTTLQENGYYEATATINIWLEGTDPETTRALSGGKYTVSLSFVASETEQVQTTTSAE